MLRILSLVFILSLALACSPASPEETPVPTLADTWSVQLTQSGGFAGVHRVVTVNSDGQVVAVDERADHTGTLQLTPGQLDRLADQVLAAMTMKPARLSSNCADCFIYDLEIRTDGTTFSVQLDDVTLPDSGLEPLVMSLRDLMEQALSTQ